MFLGRLCGGAFYQTLGVDRAQGIVFVLKVGKDIGTAGEKFAAGLGDLFERSRIVRFATQAQIDEIRGAHARHFELLRFRHAQGDVVLAQDLVNTLLKPAFMAKFKSKTRAARQDGQEFPK